MELFLGICIGIGIGLGLAQIVIVLRKHYNQISETISRQSNKKCIIWKRGLVTKKLNET